MHSKQAAADLLAVSWAAGTEPYTKFHLFELQQQQAGGTVRLYSPAAKAYMTPQPGLGLTTLHGIAMVGQLR